MIYSLSLQSAGLAAGILLIFTHAFAFWRQTPSIAWARGLPRSRGAAGVLVAAAAVWSFLLVRDIDLGEFSPLRTVMLVAGEAVAVGVPLMMPVLALSVRPVGSVPVVMAFSPGRR